MKKNGILNGPLSKIIAQLGHTDRLVVCDCGLPIPPDSITIDLALTKNIPRFIDTLKIILEEFAVEKAVLAKEIIDKNNALLEQILPLLKGIEIEKVSHEKFKDMTKKDGTIVFVRTGEATPYANIILTAGVTFN
jgi:D-ribose pyranase